MFKLSLNQTKFVNGGVNGDIEYLGTNIFGDDSVKLDGQVFTIPSENQTALHRVAYSALGGILGLGCFVSGVSLVASIFWQR